MYIDRQDAFVNLFELSRSVWSVQPRDPDCLVVSEKVKVQMWATHQASWAIARLREPRCTCGLHTKRVGL